MCIPCHSHEHATKRGTSYYQQREQINLQPLSDQFEDVFDVPTKLPPKREYDHRIPLNKNLSQLILDHIRIPQLKKIL